MSVRSCPWLPLIVLLAAPGLGRACSVPVFRYALERWASSPYELVVFHRGTLAQDARNLVKGLEEPATPMNLSVQIVDLAAKVEPPLAKLWEEQGADAALPWMVLRLPVRDEKGTTAWAGPLNEKNVKALEDSPARREIVRRLSRGDAVVFVALDGDDKTAALLGEQLPHLEKQIELPEPTRDGPQVQSKVPLRVAFSTVPLKRNDPAEQIFLRMLMHSQEGLDDVRGPIVFPIFGRGRSLYGLHAPDLDADEIRSVARFLCGACSCQVKDLNPGLDLLVSANWEKILGLDGDPMEEEPKASVPAKPEIAAGLPAASDVPPEDEMAKRTGLITPLKGKWRLWLWAAAALAGALTIVTGILAAIRTIASRERQRPEVQPPVADAPGSPQG